MRKYYILIVLLLLSGCSINKFSINDKFDIKTEVAESSNYEDTSSITVGIYNNRVLQKEYTSHAKSGTDIGYFTIALTNESKLSTNAKYSFINTAKKYPNINEYKVGYYLSYYYKDEFKEYSILNPDIMFNVSPFIYYLYDDVHSIDGVRYSHLEKMNPDTIASSFKLYANGDISTVRDIELTAFVYRPNDINENGFYRGNNKYTIKIKLA